MDAAGLVEFLSLLTLNLSPFWLCHVAVAKLAVVFFVEIWWALCFWRHSWPSTLTCVLVQCPDSFPPGMPLSWICAMLCAIGSGYCTWYIGAISIVGRQPDLSHQSLVNGDQPIIKVVCIYIYIHMQCVWINDKCIVYGICIYCTDYIYMHVFFPSAEWLYPI